MNLSLDGSTSIDQQSIMLHAAENTGKKLLSIAPDLERPHFNNAVLDKLKLGDPLPPKIELSTDGLPAGKTLVWMGIIYADKKLTPAIAYR